ncbi:hypothetical protein ACHAXA_002212 [Cyclostephanos tholiformis]|uniref:Peroxisomal membrane protein PEX16 n=1 Tax=Cyclostephanos tholiformis TaxID=382380 RepID=A0ABD3RX24_9STRA
MVRGSIESSRTSDDCVKYVHSEGGGDDVKLCSSSIVTSLVARHPSDGAGEGVGRVPPSSSSLSCPDSRASSLMMMPRPILSSSDNYHVDAKGCGRRRIPTLVEKYRNFLVKYEPSLYIFENIMERFEYYVLFRYDNGMLCELYYATWNAIRHVNDVVLSGFGDGMGTTIGTRGEWLEKSSSSPSQSSLPRLGSTSRERGRGRGGEDIDEDPPSPVIIPDLNTMIMDHVVLALRSLLTATICVHPAVEAWSRRSSSSRRYHGASSSRGDVDDDDHHREGGGGWIWRAARASHRLERVRFVARFALLSISWWAQIRRRRVRTMTNDEGCDSRRRRREGEGTVGSRTTMMPSFCPTLRGGGELDPHERVSSLRDVEDELKIVEYVGRRTGRRSIAGGFARTPPPLASLSSTVPRPSSPAVVARISALTRWLSGLTTAFTNGIVYVHAVGELLHILRPLYWSAANDKWRRSSMYSSTSVKSSRRREALEIGPSHSFSIWKAWWLSLLMDLISDRLLRTGNIDNHLSSDHAQSRRLGGHSLGGVGFDRPLTSVDRAKLEQLDYRRHRHRLYLLRSPFYDTISRPVAVFLAKFMSLIPSFGLGQWASGYVLDMMDYWNNNHFMLES